jgi:hypothetical protein
VLVALYGLAPPGAETVQGARQTGAPGGEGRVLEEPCLAETVVDVVGAILGAGVRRTPRQEILVAVRPLQARLALKRILRDGGEQDPRRLGAPPRLGLRGVPLALGVRLALGVPLAMAVREDGARDGAPDGPRRRWRSTVHLQVHAVASGTPEATEETSPHHCDKDEKQRGFAERRCHHVESPVYYIPIGKYWDSWLHSQSAMPGRL